MKEKYVVKTRNDEEEYLAYCSHKDSFYLSEILQYAEKYESVEEARKWVDVQVLKDSKYKADIFKIIQGLEFVERGV